MRANTVRKFKPGQLVKLKHPDLSLKLESVLTDTNKIDTYTVLYSSHSQNDGMDAVMIVVELRKRTNAGIDEIILLHESGKLIILNQDIYVDEPYIDCSCARTQYGVQWTTYLQIIASLRIVVPISEETSEVAK